VPTERKIAEQEKKLGHRTGDRPNGERLTEKKEGTRREKLSGPGRATTDNN
jgi:hypothetical protein